jgi:hypothetical protein
MDGLRCSRLLWFDYFRQDAFPVVCDDMYEEGRQVGELARTMFPGGILIGRDPRPPQHHKKSTQALENRKPLFEAGFVYKRLYALADILCPTEDGDWDLFEVKSSTSVKEDHLYDMAFQKYVYENAGVPIRRCFITYVNNRYLRNGPLDPLQLFLQADITEGAQDMEGLVNERVTQFLDVLERKDPPLVPIGPHCLGSRECPLKYLCWKHLPARDHVFSLSRGKELAFSLADKGIMSLFDIPDDSILTPRQRTQIQCHRNNEPFVNKARLRRFLGTLTYPLAFLDFETIGPALPVFDSTRPYEQLPFQFSLFIKDAEGAPARYYAHLHRETGDPRPLILEELDRLLGSSGSIVAYNAKFEIGVLRSTAAAYPRYSQKVEKLASRFVDLLEPFMGFYYYHPGQEGRNSLKFVLPALTGTSYKGLAISNGIEASSRYYRVTYGKDVSVSERERVYAALDEYCKQDTKGMIDVLDVLRSSVRP